MKLWLLSESPHTRVIAGEELPLIKIGDRVDWGFEDMGLSQFGVRKLERAIRFGDGVVLTGTGFVLKAPYTEMADGKIVSRYPETVIVPPVRRERPIELPAEWIRSIYVVNSDYDYTWIGDRCRENRYGGEVVTNKMKRVANGWVREI